MAKARRDGDARNQVCADITWRAGVSNGNGDGPIEIGVLRLCPSSAKRNKYGGEKCRRANEIVFSSGVISAISAGGTTSARLVMGLFSKGVRNSRVLAESMYENGPCHRLRCRLRKKRTPS